MAYNKESQMKATAKYKAKVGRVTVSFDLNLTDRETWKKYASMKGLSLSALARSCVTRCMELDGLNVEKEKGE